MDRIKLKADKFVNDKKLKLNYIKPKDLKLLLAEFCEEQIAELKAECDFAIEGRDVKIKELEAQIEKMKRCSNCRYSTDLGYCKIRCNGGECNKMDKWEIKEK